jgi:hypothetical protein
MGILEFLLSQLIPIAVALLKNYGLPALEKAFPSLVPLITEILAILNGQAPSEEMKAASDHFNNLISQKRK